MKQSLLKASVVLTKVVPGLTEESVAKLKLALEDPEHKLRLRVYFLAARKRWVHSRFPSVLILSLMWILFGPFSYKVSQMQNTEPLRVGPHLPIRVTRRLFGAILPSYWTGMALAGAAGWFISSLRWR